MRDHTEQALDIERTRTLTPLTAETFHIVDGVEFPELLLTDEIDPNTINAGNRNIHIADFSLKSVQNATRRGLGFSVTGDLSSSFSLGRSLTKSPLTSDTYEGNLGLREKGFQDIVQKTSEDFGGEPVAVVDLGCGYGTGFSEILEIEQVDEKKSTGVTMHDPFKVDLSAQERIAYGNILFLKPNGIRFHIAVSVYGAITYHPLNKVGGLTAKMFSVLQTLNMLRIRGILLTNESLDPAFSELNKMGITETPTDLDEFFEQPQYMGNLWTTQKATRKLRRPTIEEIKLLLETNQEGKYWL